MRLTCHCGAVELSILPATPLEQAKRCDCSLCRRRGVPMLAVRLDDLEVVQGAEALTLYQFNTGVARHYFCRHCGIYTHHQRRSNPNEFGVNLGAIDGVNPRDFPEFSWVDGVNHPLDRLSDQ